MCRAQNPHTGLPRTPPDGLVYALVGALLEAVERVLRDISHRIRMRRIYTEHGAQGRRGLRVCRAVIALRHEYVRKRVD